MAHHNAERAATSHDSSTASTGPLAPASPRSEPLRKEGPSNPIHVRSRAEFERHLNGGKPVIADLWAPWCGPCKMMAPIFDRVGKTFEGSVRFLKVNTEELPDVADALGVRAIPTIVALRGSEVIDVHVGLVNAADLTTMARRIAKKSR